MLYTGIYGYPPDEACDVALLTTKTFLENHGKVRSILALAHWNPFKSVTFDNGESKRHTFNNTCSIACGSHCLFAENTNRH